MKHRKDILTLFYLTSLILFGFYFLGLLVFIAPDSSIIQGIRQIWQYFGSGTTFFIGVGTLFLGIFLILYLITTVSTRRTRTQNRLKHDSNKPQMKLSSLPSYMFPLVIIILLAAVIYITLQNSEGVIANSQAVISGNPESFNAEMESQMNQFMLVGIGIMLILLVLFMRQSRGSKQAQQEQLATEEKRYYTQAIADILSECYYVATKSEHPGDAFKQVATILTTRIQTLDKNKHEGYRSWELLDVYLYENLGLPRSRINELIRLLELQQPSFTGRNDRERKELANVLGELEQLCF